eukprot:jgi/Bigna1/132767/aug1.19_g7475
MRIFVGIMILVGSLGVLLFSPSPCMKTHKAHIDQLESHQNRDYDSATLAKSYLRVPKANISRKLEIPSSDAPKDIKEKMENFTSASTSKVDSGNVLKGKKENRTQEEAEKRAVLDTFNELSLERGKAMDSEITKLRNALRKGERTNHDIKSEVDNTLHSQESDEYETSLLTPEEQAEARRKLAEALEEDSDFKGTDFDNQRDSDAVSFEAGDLDLEAGRPIMDFIKQNQADKFGGWSRDVLGGATNPKKHGHKNHRQCASESE